MPHEFGGLDIPVQVEGVGDPTLQPLVDYFEAVLNAKAQTSWDVEAAQQPVVRTTFTHDPTKADFAESTLPALYCYRENRPSQRERLADDIEADRSALIVLWVPEPANQDRIRARAPFPNAVYKVIQTAVYAERDLAWVAPSDPDADAALYGSWLLGQLRISALKVLGAQDATLVVPMMGGQPKEYPMLRIQLEALECLELALEPPYAEPAAVSIDVISADAEDGDDWTLVEFDDPVITP